MKFPHARHIRIYAKKQYFSSLEQILTRQFGKIAMNQQVITNTPSMTLKKKITACEYVTGEITKMPLV